VNDLQVTLHLALDDEDAGVRAVAGDLLASLNSSR
jgi:hypothetical protein